MDLIARPLAWAGGALAFGAADLYAVGGGFGHGDLLLLGIGAAPVIAFGVFALFPRDPMLN